MVSVARKSISHKPSWSEATEKALHLHYTDVSDTRPPAEYTLCHVTIQDHTMIVVCPLHHHQHTKPTLKPAVCLHFVTKAVIWQ